MKDINYNPVVENAKQSNVTLWSRLTEYTKICKNALCWDGATYAIVFNSTMPKYYNQPYEFEGCVYIGESVGWAYDSKVFTSNLSKRISTHKAALSRGTNNESSYRAIIDCYAITESEIPKEHWDELKIHRSGLDLDGNVTDSPWWLGIVCPNPDLPKKFLKGWCKLEERKQLMEYCYKYGSYPIGNLDCQKEFFLSEDIVNLKNRNPESKSYKRLTTFKPLPAFN